MTVTPWSRPPTSPSGSRWAEPRFGHPLSPRATGTSVDDPEYVAYLDAVGETAAAADALRADYDRLEAIVDQAEQQARISGDDTLLEQVQATEQTVDQIESRVDSARLEADSHWAVDEAGSFTQQTLSTTDLATRLQADEVAETEAELVEETAFGQGAPEPEPQPIVDPTVSEVEEAPLDQGRRLSESLGSRVRPGERSAVGRAYVWPADREEAGRAWDTGWASTSGPPTPPPPPIATVG